MNRNTFLATDDVLTNVLASDVVRAVGDLRSEDARGVGTKQRGGAGGGGVT